MNQRLVVRVTSVLLIGLLLSCLAWLGSARGDSRALPAGCTTASGQVICTYTTPGQSVQLPLPEGLTSVQVTAVGGTGGG